MIGDRGFVVDWRFAIGDSARTFNQQSAISNHQSNPQSKIINQQYF